MTYICYDDRTLDDGDGDDDDVDVLVIVVYTCIDRTNKYVYASLYYIWPMILLVIIFEWLSLKNKGWLGSFVFPKNYIIHLEGKPSTPTPDSRPLRRG